MTAKRTCKKRGADITHRIGQARQCEKCAAEALRVNNHSLGKTCPDCGVPIANTSAHCPKHTPRAMEKQERNQQILDLYASGVKCIRIAEQFGIERERVRQILVKNGINEPRKQVRHCKYCGVEVVGRDYCCNQHYELATQRTPCPICYRPMVSSSTQCRKCGFVDPWEVNKVVCLHDSGLSGVEIAKQLGRSPTFVSHCLIFAERRRGKGWSYNKNTKDKPNACWICGVPISWGADSCRKHRIDPYLINTIISLRRSAMTFDDVAKQVGFGHVWVRLLYISCVGHDGRQYRRSA